MTVLDVNDNAPVLDRRDISIIVSEGESLQQTLLTLRASDADSGSNAEITYSLAGGEGGVTSCRHSRACMHHWIF